jgi:transposase InsO family protein
MVELARVSRASFYRFSEEAKPDRDMDLRDAIQRIALEWPSYGRPRITAELRRRGWTVNPKRVYRLLREDNLLCVRKRKFVVTTDSNHGRKVCRKPTLPAYQGDPRLARDPLGNAGNFWNKIRQCNLWASRRLFAPSRPARYTIRRSKHRMLMPASKPIRRNAAARRHWQTQRETQPEGIGATLLFL